MNQLGIALVWCALQVSLLGLIAATLYASARRWGPTARSHIALVGMVLVLALTAFAFSPWPRWQFTMRDDAPSPSTAQPVAAPEITTARRDHSPARDAVRPEPPSAERNEQPAVASAFWTTFIEELGRPQAVPDRAEWRWPSIIAALFLAGTAFGTARLLAGWWAVRTLRRKSEPIHDPAMVGLLDVVQAELSCRRPIELCESPSLVTAATIGWRKPLILLPAEWADWTEAERHAVLAHEIAHIGRHDFAAWIFAECGLVLHFYHPLVHWLAGRLRLEQELAADAAAAAVTGGQRPYLTTLAAMALRQPDRPLSWPARTFLPTRRTFLRRIEMLRDSTILNARASAGVRFAALGLLFLAGLGVAGLRGPVLQAQNEPPKNRTSDATKAAENASPESRLQLRYIPRDAIGVAAARVAEIYDKMKSPQLAQLVRESDFEKRFGVPIDAIEQVTIAFGEDTQGDGPEPEPAGIIVQTRTAQQAERLVKALAGDKAQTPFPGKPYLVEPSEPRGQRLIVPDDRTVIAIGNGQKYVLAFANASREPQENAFVWSDSLKAVQGAHAAVALDVTWLPAKMTKLAERPPGTPQGELAGMLKLFSPFWLNTRTIGLGVSLREGVKLEGIADATSPEGAQRIEETAQALLTLARNLIGQGREQIAQAPAPERELMTQIITLGEDLLKSARVTRDDSTVRLEAQAEGDGATALIAAQVFPAVAKARETAQRQMSINSLKNIALAMYNYNAANGHLPPAVILGPDGKTPHSWRVALLPYLDQAELYEQYRLNEPWDSENNRKVLEKMPAIYRSPKVPEDATTTAYFVLTSPPAENARGLGKASLFSNKPGKEGPSFDNILDGLSNTILAVEAKRDVPWTRPEDIPIDPDKELPELGGFYEDGWVGALSSGAVRFFSRHVDENVLRGLITPAGNEILPDISRPADRQGPLINGLGGP